MSARLMPRYPIFVPSKGRWRNCLTAKFLRRDRVPFKLVVEPREADFYVGEFGEDHVLVLPADGHTVMNTRNWIKDLSTANGDARHWQLDDNIRAIRSYWKKRRIRCTSGAAFRVTEDFVDRYENVAIAGMNYAMFGVPTGKEGFPPFWLNVHVYSCTLVNNAIPHRWRRIYNEDTDMCLQVLADGWCTLSMNMFLAEKVRTMLMKGGNTDALYQNDGRLVMAKSLERDWPKTVRVDRRFKRPQHVVYDEWRRFDTQLIPKPNLGGMPTYDDTLFRLVQIAPEVRAGTLRDATASDPRFVSRTTPRG